MVLAASALIFAFCGCSSHQNIVKNETFPNPIVDTIESDIQAVSLSIFYDSNSIQSDYIVETENSLPDTSKYVIERRADKGLVEFPCTGEQLKQFKFPHDGLVAVIKTKYNMSVCEKTDFILRPDSIYAVNTSQRNAGIFTGSDIYPIPRLSNKSEYEKYFSGLSDKCQINKFVFFKFLDFIEKHKLPLM